MSDSEGYDERVSKVHYWWCWNLRVVQRDTVREFQRYTPLMVSECMSGSEEYNDKVSEVYNWRCWSV